MAGNKLKNRNKKQNERGKQRATQATDTTVTPYGSARESVSQVQPFGETSAATAPAEKRDSVISSTWDETKREDNPDRTSDPRGRPGRRGYGRWWPCRLVGSIYQFFLAIARAYQGPQRPDVFLTLCLLALTLIAGYVAIELLIKVLQGVAAHETGDSCGIVYVTVPGSISTVSWVGGAPSDPAHATYCFSVVDGTTQWLGSIAGPDGASTMDLQSTTAATTLPPPSFDNTSTIFGERYDLATRVISYGDAAFRFVFPMPNITTTISYWTGVYPTVTGPLPSEFQTLPSTTKTRRQTPLSALPPFEIFTSKQSQFRTTVTRIPRKNATSGPIIARRIAIESTASVRTTAAQLSELVPTQAFTALAEPEPTLCGESGNFTLTFDDTVVGGDNKVLLVANGMKNPYHHLFYANGFTYVPDKWEPYPAVSQPNVAMFLPLAGRLLPNTPFAGTMLPGELGAGPRASVSAYWFNAYSAYFGCALNGLTPCILRISGYRYDSVLRDEVLVVEQTATLPACWGYIKCRLTRVFFNNQFRALSGIQFNAYTYNLGIPQIHMMDDLQMEWYNNSCSAGILRIGHR